MKVFLALIAVLAGCGAGGASPTIDAGTTGGGADAGAVAGADAGTVAGADAGAGPSAVEVASARALIEATLLLELATVDRLYGIRFTAAGLAASTDLLRDGVAGDPLWGALYVYGGQGVDPAPLRPYLVSSDATVRSFVSEGLAAMGDVSGLESLAQELVDDNLIAASEPPAAVWEAALVSLERYTGKTDLSPASSSPSDRQASRDRWTAWIAQNKARLVFDSAARLWRIQ